MNDNKRINSHYLSLSYKSLINKNIIHFFLFIIEVALLFLQIIEVYYNDYSSFNKKENKIFSPLTFLALKIDKLPNILKEIIYPILIVVITINAHLLNLYSSKINTIIKIMENLSEILFYRILSLALFNFLFIFKDIYLIINIIITIPYIIILVFNFCHCHLFLFFPSLIKYPYDSFSMIIDLHLIFIKIFLSLAKMGSNRYISKFTFFLSIFFMCALLFYLTYIMIYKSYYLMNNNILNNARYSTLLSLCISIIISLLIDKHKIVHIYIIIIFCNIVLLCLIFVSFFYDPYKYAKFDKDDNIENIYYYFFMFDKDKNKYFLIEEKIEEHISKCNMCNLCKKYNIIKNQKDKSQFDLFKIIYNGKDQLFNLMNIIIRRIKKKGKNSFINNSYYLINIIYNYCIAVSQRNINILLNLELIFEIINSENKQILEENKISLNRIKYTNDFFIKAKKVIQDIYYLLQETKFDRFITLFFKLEEEIEKIKNNEIKSNLNSGLESQNFNGMSEGLSNCNNLLSICSLFYEELFNEIISNSGVSIKDNPNLLEDLVNNNNKYSKHITLEINILTFEVKIIRAGGEINKYENKNFFDFFLKLVKNYQIFEMKKVLLKSNHTSDTNSKKNKKKEKKFTKIAKKKQNIIFNFLIEERENNDILCKLLKLKMNLILLTHIDNKIYLNGIYNLNKDIIITEEKKNEEILLYFGNKKQIKICNPNRNKIIIKRNRNEKYLGNERLLKSTNFILGSKNYNVYHFLIEKKQSIFNIVNINNNRLKLNELEEDQMRLLDKINNNVFLFNDLQSHASSGNNSMGRNTLISYNRENKKIDQKNNETKELKILKYILLFVIAIFLSLLIILSFLLKKSFKKTEKLANFFLSFSDYSNEFHNLFCSTLLLACIARTSESKICFNYFSQLEAMILSIAYGLDNEELWTYDRDSYLIKYSKYLFYQNNILLEDINSKLSFLMKNITKFNDNLILKNMDKKITHFKMNQNYLNDKIILTLTKETITFSDFNLLMISRLSTLSIDMNNTKQAIYILNKTGDNVFNNVYLEDKLSSYQENFYLIILDFKIYTSNLNQVMNEIGKISEISKTKFKNLIIIFLNIFLFLVIIIYIFLLLLIFVYLFILLKTLRSIKKEMKEKINDITVKEILKKKIDNLQMLLKFYDNDINKTILKLNRLYDYYRDNYNLKLKEELKLLKREGKKEFGKENKNSNCIKDISTIKEYKLYKYAIRNKIFLYLIINIIIITLAIYFINLFIWLYTFRKESKIMEWKSINDNAIITTNKLISSYLLMIYDNQTLEEISKEYESNNFISYIFTELTPLYNLGKYNKYINNNNYLSAIESSENCWDIYMALNIDIFNKLFDKFMKEKDQFQQTMTFLCEMSFIMTFNNYKAIFLQLFSLVQKGIENFNNIKYSDIITSIKKKEILEISLIYMSMHKYLIDYIILINKNIILMTIKEIGNKLIITNIIVYPIIFILIFISFFVYVKNVNNNCKKIIHIKKIFKICNLN